MGLEGAFARISSSLEGFATEKDPCCIPLPDFADLGEYVPTWFSKNRSLTRKFFFLKSPGQIRLSWLVFGVTESPWPGV